VKSLPRGFGQIQNQKVEGPYLLELTEVLNISMAAFEDQNKDVNAARRCLRLTLTDGIQTIRGFEYKGRISGVTVQTPVGSKFVVRGVNVRHGYLYLMPENCRLVGGQGPPIEKDDDNGQPPGNPPENRPKPQIAKPKFGGKKRIKPAALPLAPPKPKPQPPKVFKAPPKPRLQSFGASVPKSMPFGASVSKSKPFSAPNPPKPDPEKSSKRRSGIPMPTMNKRKRLNPKQSPIQDIEDIENFSSDEDAPLVRRTMLKKKPPTKPKLAPMGSRLSKPKKPRSKFQKPRPFQKKPKPKPNIMEIDDRPDPMEVEEKLVEANPQKVQQLESMGVDRKNATQLLLEHDNDLGRAANAFWQRAEKKEEPKPQKEKPKKKTSLSEKLGKKFSFMGSSDEDDIDNF